MNIEEYQFEARKFNMVTGYPQQLMHAFAGLGAEAGECLGVFQKAFYKLGLKLPYLADADDLPESVKAQLVLELGDVFYYLGAAADALGLSLQAIAEANIAKLKERHGDPARRGE